MDDERLIEELEDTLSTVVMLAKSPTKFGLVSGLEGEMLNAIQVKAERGLDVIYEARESR